MGRPRIGTPEEAAERRRQLTAARVRRLRGRRRASASAPAGDPVAEAPAPSAPAVRTADTDLAAMMLRRFVERLERLEAELAGTRTRDPALADAGAAERRQIGADLKATWKEIKGVGFSVAATREILRLRKMGEAKRREFEATVSAYKQALGMQ